MYLLIDIIYTHIFIENYKCAEFVLIPSVCFLDSKTLIKNCPNILRVFKKPSAMKTFSFSILFPV